MATFRCRNDVHVTRSNIRLPALDAFKGAIDVVDLLIELRYSLLVPGGVECLRPVEVMVFSFSNLSCSLR